VRGWGAPRAVTTIAEAGNATRPAQPFAQRPLWPIAPLIVLKSPATSPAPCKTPPVPSETDQTDSARVTGESNQSAKAPREQGLR